MIIVPSILEKTTEDLFNQITKLSPYFNHFQIDIADGVFVPNKTVQIEEIYNSISNFKLQILNSSFEFHLMVKDYEAEIKKLEELKNSISIKSVLIHLSTVRQYNDLITKQVNIGIVLSPEDTVEQLTANCKLSALNLIQIMSVHPGSQGQDFLPETLQKVEQLRLLNYRNKISLDGAINDQTIPLILSQKYLPDVLCPGSFLTRTGDLDERLKFLKILQEPTRRVDFLRK